MAVDAGSPLLLQTFASTLYSQGHLAEFDETLKMFGDPEAELKALLAGKEAFDVSPWHFGYAVSLV